MTAHDATARTYNRWAGSYDRRWRHYTDVTLGYLLAHLALDRYGDVLDVGCGTGTLLQRLGLRTPGARLFGVDASAGMLRRAGRKLAGQGVELRLGHACRLPFADGTMDLVIMASMLRYLKRPSLACAEARRILRPGGTLAVVGYLPRGKQGSAMDGLIRRYDRGHIRNRTRAEVSAVLVFAGFRVIQSADFPIDRIFRGVFAMGILPR
ncbi:MAG TPA: class I SAM-dependent methyltransferase [Chloroflexota bacterium]|nr:class I SAM-dependent methyltransferase [Chloroflexota bacterium]